MLISFFVSTESSVPIDAESVPALICQRRSCGSRRRCQERRKKTVDAENEMGPATETMSTALEVPIAHSHGSSMIRTLASGTAEACSRFANCGLVFLWLSIPLLTAHLPHWWRCGCVSVELNACLVAVQTALTSCGKKRKILGSIP